MLLQCIYQIGILSAFTVLRPSTVEAVLATKVIRKFSRQDLSGNKISQEQSVHEVVKTLEEVMCLKPSGQLVHLRMF